MNRKWSDWEVQTLRRIAALGGSFSDAAAFFSVTRSAVAGKADRLGISFSSDNDRLPTSAAIRKARVEQMLREKATTHG